MAELRINTTGKLSLFDADDSHAASIIAGTVSANENVMTLATAGVTFNVPTITLGDATAEDTKIVFDGNAVDYRMGLDDSADTLEIGIGSTHATTAQISLNATGFVFNEQSSDYDFRVESNGNANMIFVDGGNDHVNIGTASDLGGVLNVAGDMNVTGSPFTLTNTTDDNNIDIKTTSSGSLVHALKIHAAGTFEAKQGAIFNEDSNDVDFRVESNGNANMLFVDAGNDRIGIMTASPGFAFDIAGAEASNYAVKVMNDGNNANRYGQIIQCGADDNSGTNYALSIRDGDGDQMGNVTFSGGTVTYGTFTAHHPCIVPNADNDSSSADNAYPYGTLVETTSISYTQKNGSDTERGIRYNVQKTSSAYSRKVLGAYGLSMNTGPGNYDDDDVLISITNEHQALVLGDGHILCNNEKGNISIGDGICSSSTAGIGMKADKMAMIVGIAQEDVTFSGSETKLIAVQYGVRQFTPWTD